MADSKEYIRLDLKEGSRFVSFPETMLRAIGKLLPRMNLEVTAGTVTSEEIVAKTSARDLPAQQMVRTIVVPQAVAGAEFLQSLLSNNGETARSIVVTGFVRTTGLGAGRDNHGQSFMLEDYATKPIGKEVSLEGAAKTKFQEPKGNFVERFFGSKAGTVATIGAIIGGSAALHFGALSEQRNRVKVNEPEPLADKISAIVENGAHKPGERVVQNSQENQR